MNSPRHDTYVVTGPTSGIGLHAALDLSEHSIVILVGRDRRKLDGVRKQIERAGGQAFAVVCDLSDPGSVQRAAREIIAIERPIAGVLNNAGVMLTKPGKNAFGWDMTFATNHLGPFALTEALAPICLTGRISSSSRPGSKTRNGHPSRLWGCAAVDIFPQPRVRGANGCSLGPRSQASTLMRLPNNAPLLPPLLFPGNCRGCTSTRLSRASTRRPALAAQTVSCVSCLVKSSHGFPPSTDTEIRPSGRRA